MDIEVIIPAKEMNKIIKHIEKKKKAGEYSKADEIILDGKADSLTVKINSVKV